MADELEVAQPTVQGWESNEHAPRAERLPRVAEVYGLELEALVAALGRAEAA